MKSSPPAPRRSLVDRALAALDRVPGLGDGRTHVVFLALFFAVSLSLYLVVLRLRGPAVAFVTWTEWDRLFPFTPWWTWLYLLPYVVGPLLVAVLRRPWFAWYIRRAFFLVVVSLIIFAAVPTQTVRPLRDPDPELQERNRAQLDHDLTSWLYRQMEEIDEPPANAAPSLHVSLSCLLAWALAFDWPRWKWAALAAAVLVWLSTLYTAQHHLIDVVSGTLLATAAAFWRRGAPAATQA
jgi:membrane-associated phospholipid phosphatase